MNESQTRAITIDIDWAPDWMILEAAAILVQHNTKATWFVTHASPALAILQRHPHLFELGVHPNCHSGSSHGASEEQVLDHVLNLVPGALSMRTHGLFQSTSFLLKAAARGIRNDISLFLPGLEGVGSHTFNMAGLTLRRLTYCWEDGYELHTAVPNWNPPAARRSSPGVGVFNFHPVHIALNSCSTAGYVSLKAARPISDVSPEDVAPFIHDGEGAATMFRTLAQGLSGGGATVSEIAAREAI